MKMFNSVLRANHQSALCQAVEMPSAKTVDTKIRVVND